MRQLVFAFALALAACGAPTTPGAPAGDDDVPHIVAADIPAAPDETAACNVRQEALWRAGETELRLIGDYEGQTCAGATMRFVIADEAGRLLYLFEQPARDFLPPLGAGPDGNDEMRAGVSAMMAGWIDPSDRAMPSTTDLPPWPEGAPAPAEPGDEEMPFAPAPDFDRAAYLALRASGAPMWCFLSGAAVSTCVVYEAAGGGVREIGRQQHLG